MSTWQGWLYVAFVVDVFAGRIVGWRVSSSMRPVKVLGGTKWQQFLKVFFPTAIPSIISTMKVNIGLALTGKIVGELLAAQSDLGHLIIYSRNIFNMTLVMKSLAILAVIATLMYLAVWLLSATSITDKVS